MTVQLEENYVSKFDEKQAARLAAIACTDRVRSPFIGREAELLNALQAAEWALHEELHEFNIDTFQSYEELIEERKRLEAFKEHLDRFVYHWKQLGWFEKEEMLSGWHDGGESILEGVSFEEACYPNGSIGFFEGVLRKMQTNLPLAVAVRGEGNSGPKVNHPELKIFVREIRNAWMVNDSAPAFGANFEVSANHHPDKRPVSVAAKLVFEAARMINPKYTGIDCETAMRAVKSESKSLSDNN